MDTTALNYPHRTSIVIHRLIHNFIHRHARINTITYFFFFINMQARSVFACLEPCDRVARLARFQLETVEFRNAEASN